MAPQKGKMAMFSMSNIVLGLGRNAKSGGGKSIGTTFVFIVLLDFVLVEMDKRLVVGNAGDGTRGAHDAEVHGAARARRVETRRAWSASVRDMPVRRVLSPKNHAQKIINKTLRQHIKILRNPL